MFDTYLDQYSLIHIGFGYLIYQYREQVNILLIVILHAVIETLFYSPKWTDYIKQHYTFIYDMYKKRKVVKYSDTLNLILGWMIAKYLNYQDIVLITTSL